MRRGLAAGADGEERCDWGAEPEIYRAYHDAEWGRPVVDDEHLFERVVLEGFQAGLAWITILRKREAFRSAFAGFQPAAVAAFDASDVARLLGDPGIVRHRGKIEAAIGNARCALEMIGDHGSLAAFFWPLSPAPAPPPPSLDDVPAATDTSAALSRHLKQRGWRFVGPTTMYAFMQATGLVNDHLAGCFVRDRVEAMRAPVPERYRGGPPAA